MTALRKEVKDEIINEVAEDIDAIQQTESQLHEELQNLKDEDVMLHAELQEVAGTLNNVTAGVLSIQGKDFKSECRYLLDDDHKITTDEFEELEDEFSVYTNLGGNGRGAELFNAVRSKWLAEVSQGNK